MCVIARSVKLCVTGLEKLAIHTRTVSIAINIWVRQKDEGLTLHVTHTYLGDSLTKSALSTTRITCNEYALNKAAHALYQS